MKRKQIDPKVQKAVLLESRRRCCICFGLNRDILIKQGQIAHLDQDPSNGAKDNLAFLCFDHHDQYDSRRRQGKNFTVLEVKEFRSELVSTIRETFSGGVAFGGAKRAPVDSLAGHYIRSGDYASAEFKISRLADGRCHVAGFALWGKGREYGPNIGELDFVAEDKGRRIRYTETTTTGKDYVLEMKFKDGKLVVVEENWVGMFGMNVMFSGDYEKAT